MNWEENRQHELDHEWINQQRKDNDSCLGTIAYSVVLCILTVLFVWIIFIPVMFVWHEGLCQQAIDQSSGMMFQWCEFIGAFK